MAYVPDPADNTEPVDGRPAGTAAAEFRALKGRVNSIASLSSKIYVQDDPPVPDLTQGQQWFESDSGHLYMRYQNPDLTFCWIKVNGFVA